MKKISLSCQLPLNLQTKELREKYKLKGAKTFPVYKLRTTIKKKKENETRS
jgi:hypothetical protein